MRDTYTCYYPLTCISYYIAVLNTDESPSYICVNPLLLDAAEKLPTTQKALSILCSPLPASMRLDPSPTTTTSGVGGGGGKDTPVPVPPVDILEAIRSAIEMWEIEVEKGKIESGENIIESVIVSYISNTNHTAYYNTTDNNNNVSNVVSYIEE